MRTKRRIGGPAVSVKAQPMSFAIDADHENGLIEISIQIFLNEIVMFLKKSLHLRCLI